MTMKPKPITRKNPQLSAAKEPAQRFPRRLGATPSKLNLSSTTIAPAVPKLIAFYLPQYHPIPENDASWGKGFTEWTNVTKAKPQFNGHYQPQLPTELGFYDLRLRQSRRDQIKLAQEFGIDGFCYHYYWFSGKKVLNAPIDDMLRDEDSDMPFCLNWANENWTKRWDGADDDIILAQSYAETDDLDFIKSLIPFFKDPRYILIDGAPLLMVYTPQQLPNPHQSLKTWREHCASVGIARLHVACCYTHGNWDHKKFGFDSGVEFPPHDGGVADIAPELDLAATFKGLVFDYKPMAEKYLRRSYGPENSGFRGVVPSWDNTARKGTAATVVLNGTPANYEFWLTSAIDRTLLEFPRAERMIFINAWNEWAEGCHLEPCRKYERQFLEATLAAKNGARRHQAFAHVGARVFQEREAKTPLGFLREVNGVIAKHVRRVMHGISNRWRR